MSGPKPAKVDDGTAEVEFGLFRFQFQDLSEKIECASGRKEPPDQ